ncbi:MAG: PHB depolymerase family esterase, partial [Phenylobacterium sp.]|nr:PHB depolymerase family esterase [Phenylobacterium sp.]
MPSLADTTAVLKRARRVAAGTSRGGPDGPRQMVATTDFGANPGGLRMLSYTPEGLPSDAPLVVVLHGCTQGAEAFAQDSGWLTLADRFGFAVVAPEQVSGNNPNRCFNWFVPADITRGGGEAASIAAMTAHATARFETDADRVFVSGLSAGGAMAAVMLATYPDVYA